MAGPSIINRIREAGGSWTTTNIPAIGSHIHQVIRFAVLNGLVSLDQVEIEIDGVSKMYTLGPTENGFPLTATAD